MRNVTILPPASDLVGEIVSRLGTGGKDYSGDTVVFPGRRPGHALRKKLAAGVASAFIPPRIYSIDDLVAEIFTRHVRGERRLLETLDALAILYEIHVQSDGRLSEEYFERLEEFLPVGMRLLGEFEEITIADIPPNKIDDVLRGVHIQRFQSIGRYYTAFYKELERTGAVTRAVMYREVARALMQDPLLYPGRMIFAGFFAFTGVEQRLVASLAKRPDVDFIFQEGKGLSQQLQRVGLLPGDYHAVPGVLPPIRYVRAPDLLGQVLALASALGDRSASGSPPDETTAVVLPSADGLFPVLHHVLSIPGIPKYNIALGYPLVRTPVVGFLNALMDVAASAKGDRLAAHDYVKFALHPYTKNIRLNTRTDVTRVLFQTIEEYIVRRYRRRRFTLEELEGNAELLDLVLERVAGLGVTMPPDDLRRHLVGVHNGTLRPLMSSLHLGELAASVQKILSYIYQESTARLHPLFRPYVEQTLDALETLGRSLLAGRTFGTREGAFSFLRSYLATIDVPLPGTPLEGVQVLGLLETRNLRFDHLFVLDVTDDVLPGTPPEGVFLADQLRRLLGLEGRKERERLAEYYFDIAIHGARDVCLFYSEGGKKEKSRFVEQLLWRHQQAVHSVTQPDLEEQVSFSVQLVNEKPAPIPKRPAFPPYLRTRSFSATMLDTYLRCQLRFYYQFLLGLREKEELDEDVEASEIGSFVHRILKDFFTPLLGKPLAPPHMNRQVLGEVIDRCFTEQYGDPPPGTLILVKDQIRQQLGRFLEEYQTRTIMEHQTLIFDLERSITVQKNGFTFTGKVDRLEMRGDKVYILDYKTGAKPGGQTVNLKRLNPADRSTWGAGIRSFQLPVYMLLQSVSSGRPVETLYPAYIDLGSVQQSAKIEVPMSPDRGPAEAYREVEPIIFRLLDEIMDPKIPFHPADDLRKECPRCPFTNLCGTGWLKARAEAW